MNFVDKTSRPLQVNKTNLKDIVYIYMSSGYDLIFVKVENEM